MPSPVSFTRAARARPEVLMRLITSPTEVAEDRSSVVVVIVPSDSAGAVMRMAPDFTPAPPLSVESRVFSDT